MEDNKITPQKEQKKPSVDTIPMLPLRDMVVFPGMVAPLFVGRAKSMRALSEAMATDKRIFLVSQKDPANDDPAKNDIYNIGTVARVLQLLRLPDGSAKALVEGIFRASIEEYIENEEYFEVTSKPLEIKSMPEAAEIALLRSARQAFEHYAEASKTLARELIENIMGIKNPDQMADAVVTNIPFKLETKQELLSITDLEERISRLIQVLNMEIEVLGINERIKHRVQSQMDKTQRQYYLNEQLRAIKKEMGSDDENGEEIAELEEKINTVQLSDEARERANAELKKFKMMTPMSAEATVVRNYLDWILGLPWGNKSKITNDIVKAEKILDEDHFGLEKPKERILEYLAVQALVKKLRGPILCLVGPPGVGKTSLAKSIARATGRKYVRLSLGGVRDEAEIRGHRRTYIGAMPGKIIQSLKKAGVNNPVFCLDEIDKMSMDFRGDPSSALLEVLDPEQNSAFNDHYLDLDYDLSDVMFITTANTLPDIPLPLQDRMEIIQLTGYTEYDKKQIAKQFLIPKEVEANGLAKYKVHFSDNAITAIINGYTREAGVRNLERAIASVCRKLAKKAVKDKKRKEFSVNATMIKTLLGPPRFKSGESEKEDQVGIATGMAWTPVGGELLFIEALLMPGKGNVIVTGKLGDVMQESAKAAFSYVRSKADNLSIDPKYFTKYDLHIHVPEGAIPKDGPSAGITLATAIVSALTQQPVRSDLSMTGEITLRGRVLKIGGLKEKVMAAHRAGIKTILIPDENLQDVDDIPKAITNDLEIIPVKHVDEVLKLALKN